MSLSSYDGLKAAIADELNRDDLTSVIPDFITMAEAEASAKLRVRQMICRANATLASEYTALPADYCGIRAIDLLTDPVTPLEYREPEDLRQMKAVNAMVGRPRFYAIVGDQLQVYPSPDASYTVEMLAFESIPALSDANTSNWLLSRYPHAYKFGALKQSAPYLRDDSRLPMWARLFEDALASIREADAMESFGHRPAMRTRRF